MPTARRSMWPRWDSSLAVTCGIHPPKTNIYNGKTESEKSEIQYLFKRLIFSIVILVFRGVSLKSTPYPFYGRPDHDGEILKCSNFIDPWQQADLHPTSPP